VQDLTFSFTVLMLIVLIPLSAGHGTLGAKCVVFKLAIKCKIS